MSVYHVVSLPNILSVVRLAVSPLAFYWIVTDSPWTLLLLCGMALTDYFDGFLSRVLRQTSAFGQLIDPVADKVAIFFVSAAFTLNGVLPLWFFVFFCFRDLALMLGSMLLLRRKIVAQASLHGKVSSFVFFGLVLVLVLEDLFAPLFIDVCVYLSFATTLVSTLLYIYEFFTRIKDPEKL